LNKVGPSSCAKGYPSARNWARISDRPAYSPVRAKAKARSSVVGVDVITGRYGECACPPSPRCVSYVDAGYSAPAARRARPPYTHRSTAAPRRLDAGLTPSASDFVGGPRGCGAAQPHAESGSRVSLGPKLGLPRATCPLRRPLRRPLSHCPTTSPLVVAAQQPPAPQRPRRLDPELKVRGRRDVCRSRDAGRAKAMESGHVRTSVRPTLARSRPFLPSAASMSASQLRAAISPSKGPMGHA
jgi:hypothetical protein